MELSHFLTKAHFPDRAAVQLYNVRGSHIFLTKAIFPDRAAVQHYYVRGSHIFLTTAIFPDRPIVYVASYRSGCLTIYGGLIFS